MSVVSFPSVYRTSRKTVREPPTPIDERANSDIGSFRSATARARVRTAPNGSNTLNSLFQSARRRQQVGGGSNFDEENEDEEKITTDKQEQVRQRGRYSKAHMSDFGMVFSSSELGSDTGFGFNAETADPMSGQHYHRSNITLASFKPSSMQQQQQEQHATFATEEDAQPRANLQIGSYGNKHHHSSSNGSSVHDSVGQVAETTGKTIWHMWKRMKADRLRAQSQDLLRDVPTVARSGDSSPTSYGGGQPAIDYVEAGKAIASQLHRAGVKVSHNHLDVIHNLAGLERVWLKTNEGLEKDEFVDFLREVLRLPAEELSILFQKMDANCDGSLSWDEYLSYLLIEVSHHWQFRSARGTWHLKDVDSPAIPVNAQVQQILVIPRDPNASAATVNAAGKYVFACKDNSIQVWNSSNLTYQCHLPPAWKTPDSKVSIGLSGVGASATSNGGGGGANSIDDMVGLGASNLARQTARIGERRSGGARQKRCGGGGWKEDSSYSARHQPHAQQLSLMQGTVDESIARRAGLARLNLSGDRAREYEPYSSRDRSGGGSGSSVGGGMNDDGDNNPPDRYDGERDTNPFSRPRQYQGVLHTTVAYYPTQKQLLVASMDKSIHVYQQTFRQYIQVDRTEVIDTPQCMAVHLNSNNGASSYQSSSQHMRTNADLLIVGDTSGRCSAYHLPVSRDYGSSGGPFGDKSSNITSSVGKFDVVGGIHTSLGGIGLSGGSSSMPSATHLLTAFGSAARPVYQFPVHRPGESVRKVSMIANVGLVSAGMDAKLHISDLETERVIRSLDGHKRGVYSFAHCESHRCIFSAGFDSRVLVFDPYLPNATGALAGQHSNILDVVINERKNQIIVTCANKKIKIFDIRNFKCIQSLADSHEYTPYDELTAVNFDQEQQQLVTAGNKMRTWPVVIAPGNKARRGGPAHSNLVVAICFSQVFQQIISVSVDESVHLWDVWTGESVFEFRTTHGSPLTAACLDHRGKRLITGAHDGCWGAGTTILMYDGTTKPIEQIVKDHDPTRPHKQMMMGPDSKPRIITQTIQGHTQIERMNHIKDSVKLLPFDTTISDDATLDGARYPCRFIGCSSEFSSTHRSLRDLHERATMFHTCTIPLPTTYRITFDDTHLQSWTCNEKHVIVLRILNRPNIQAYTRTYPYATHHHTDHTHTASHTLTVFQPECYQLTLLDGILTPILRPIPTLGTFATLAAAEDALSRYMSARAGGVSLYDAAGVRKSVDRLPWSPLEWDVRIADYMTYTPDVKAVCTMFTPTGGVEFEPPATHIDDEPTFDRTWNIGRKLGEREAANSGEEERDNAIPGELLRQSKAFRFHLLSGLVDAIGSYDASIGAYSFTFSTREFTESVTSLARSLGLFVTTPIMSMANQWKIEIKGAIHHIPTRIHTTIAKGQSSEVDDLTLSSTSFNVVEVADASYYGFNLSHLDGSSCDGRLVLGDFLVSHNSVLMWNFNNGAKMHEFQSRKKEVTCLLYLPRTLQCVVGIGWERSVVRWPDPSAPKSTEWLVQPDHRAEVCSVAYFGSILVTGGADGEIIVWHMDSARVNKRMDLPKTPRTNKRPGVTKMIFIDFINGLLLLLAGTDDGSLHFIKIGTSETIFSMFEVFTDPIVGLAANRILQEETTTINNNNNTQLDANTIVASVDPPTHRASASVVAGARTRLMVCDCQVDAKLWDISGITSDHITDIPLIASWEPHPGGTTTDVIAVDDIGSFMSSSDTGEISIWSAIDGEGLCKFGQRKAWPIADPRTGSRTIDELESDRRDGGADARSSDDDDSSDSGLDSGPLSGVSTRRGSALGSGRASRQDPRASSSHRHHRRRRRAIQTPTRKEISFAESHPMYVPRDDCDKYLQEHAQQVAMESNQLAKERQAADRERREGEKSNKGHSKLNLADMLSKLESDLKYQHERSHGMSMDIASAVQGGHVYERFNHHTTGASVASTGGGGGNGNGGSSLHLHSTNVGVGFGNSDVGSSDFDRLIPRPPRVRHINTTFVSVVGDDDPHTASSGASAAAPMSTRSILRTIGGAITANAGANTATNASPPTAASSTTGAPPASSHSHGSLTSRDSRHRSFTRAAISNTDVFTPHVTSRIRKAYAGAQDR